MNTLALNMIVGGGESELLRRCLNSCGPDMFDEIVIVNTSNDSDIDSVVEEFGGKCVRAKWSSDKYPHGHFAAARNVAINHTESDYIMWLDTDDLLFEERENAKKKLRAVVAQNDFDYYILSYHTEVDSVTRKPISLIWRERIFKNRPDLGWTYPCHEQLSCDNEKHRHGQVVGLVVQHFPLKVGNSGLQRNVKIMQHEIEAGRECDHNLFYLGRDLYLIKDYDKALPILKNYCELEDARPQNKVYAYINLAMNVLYRQEAEDKYSVNEAGIEEAEEYIEKAMKITETFAEPFVLMGDIYLYRSNFVEAIRSYKRALGCPLGNGGIQQVQYYEELPARRLAKIYHSGSEFENALYFNAAALRFSPNDPDLIETRKMIIKSLFAGLEKELAKEYEK